MKKTNLPIPKSFIIVPLVLVTGFTVLGFGLTYLYFNKISYDRYKEDLIRMAFSGTNLLSHLKDKMGSVDYDSYADNFAGINRFRVTILDNQGQVLGDSRLSAQQIRQLENQAQRPEILKAGESGVGVSQRFSTTSGVNFLYVAAHYNSPEFTGYFRIAMPLAELEEEEERHRIFLGTFCFFTLLTAAALSFLVSRYLISIAHRGKQDLEDRVRDRTEKIEIIQNLGTQLTACNTRREVLEVIRLTTSMLMPKYTGTLALMRSSKDRLEVVESWNGQWQGEVAYAPNECWALRTGQAYRVDNKVGKIACGHSPGLKGHMSCFPLVAQGETHGVLHFASEQDVAWTSADHGLAGAVAEQTSLALANLQLRESLRQQAIRDPLTGLYNRRYLLETVDHELSRATRRDQSVSLMMIDLDHFKNFNDEYGHDIGDFILSEFGRLLRIIIREEDIPCRYGGEEFVVLFPETEEAAARLIAERIVTKVHEHEFLFNHQVYGPITISAGVSIFPKNGKTMDILIKQADNALYGAKAAGRDRVVFA